MIRSILRFLGGDDGEEKQMLLLLGKGFFMGIMIATYSVGANALFIMVIGEERLSEAFFWTGGLRKSMKLSVMKNYWHQMIIMYIEKE